MEFCRYSLGRRALGDRVLEGGTSSAHTLMLEEGEALTFPSCKLGLAEGGRQGELFLLRLSLLPTVLKFQLASSRTTSRPHHTTHSLHCIDY